MRPPVALLAAGTALLAASCAWGPGGGFSEIRPASTVTLTLPMSKGRVNSAGRWVTSNGYALTLDGGILAPAARVSLVGTTGGGGSTAFDPAKPPAGYSLCHSGHCHRNDGALILYADVEAEIIRKAGGVATASVAELTWNLADTRLEPGGEVARSQAACTPDCFLARGTIAGADLALASLAASGTVEALPGTAPLAGTTRPWTLTIKDLAPFTGNLVQTVNRDAPPGLAFGGTLALTDKLFDGVDWGAFGATDPIAVESSPAALATIRTHLASSKWTVAFKAAD